jgi:PAS domain S-box-containing protein
MKFRANIHVLSFLRASVNVASILVFGVGLLVMLGWIMDISTLRSLVPGLPALRFNTALSFLLMAGSLWFVQNEEAGSAQKGMGKTLAGLALLISLLTLSEYLFGWNLGIDELFLRDVHSAPNLLPGRMSPIAVLCSGLSSTALLVLGSRISQYFSVGVFILAIVAIMDFLFDFRGLLRNPQNTYSAVQTAGTFLVLSLAILAARPDRGMMKILSSSLPGSKAMRLLLPLIILLTVMMGWLVERAESFGYLDATQDSIILVILLIFVYSPLIYFSARNINQAEEKIVYANRLYAILSQVNEAIARVKSQRELFESICRIAVDFGRFHLAWIGLVEAATGDVKPVAATGLDVDHWPLPIVNIHAGPLAGGLVAQAIHTSNVITSENPQTDERIQVLQDRIQQHDFRSAAVVPFRLGDRVVGTLTLLSQETGLFNDMQEIHLLNEMGQDISFALDALESEKVRKRAEAHIRYQAGLLENVSDAIIASDMASHITSWNSVAAEIYGWHAEEVIGKPINDFLETEYEHGISEEYVFQQFLNQGLWRGEVTQKRKDGERITVLASVSLVRDTAGTPNAMVAVNRDITERKQAEEQIQRQIKHLNALRMIDIAISSSFDLDVILEVVLQHVLSQLGVDASAILLFNAQMQTIEYAASHGFRSNALQHTRLKLGEGYAGRAVIERKTIHISDLMETGGRLANSLFLEHESFVDYYGAPLIVKGEVKGVLEIYHRSHLKTDPEWLEFLETLAGQAAIAIDNAQLFENLQVSNLTLEHRVAERTTELNRTNAELEHANRIKDEFLANMSHELRTPLTSILGLSESLLEEIRDPLSQYQHKSLQIIEASGHHLLELINDILDLSKIEAGKFDFYPQPIAVDEICKSSLSFVKSQAVKKAITVTYIQDLSISRIFADPRRLKQILVNLLSNAVKFTPANGEVILQVNTDVEQDLIKFSVSDNGPGIAAQDLRRLFQPFVQVDSGLNRQHEGTGLGLALVQKLTDLHGGSVQVESEVGKGSRFTIHLPCLQEEIAKLEKLESQAVPPIRERAENTQVPGEAPLPLGLILLADDNLPSVLTIAEYLESHGYEVVVAHDGLEAVEKAEALHPNLILMDIQMPVMNGLEAIARLRGNVHFAETPIIALTALAMPGDRERSLLAGANEYMSKPVSLKTLKQTIQNLLQS